MECLVRGRMFGLDFGRERRGRSKQSLCRRTRRALLDRSVPFDEQDLGRRGEFRVDTGLGGGGLVIPVPVSILAHLPHPPAHDGREQRLPAKLPRLDIADLVPLHRRTYD